MRFLALVAAAGALCVAAWLLLGRCRPPEKHLSREHVRVVKVPRPPTRPQPPRVTPKPPKRPTKPTVMEGFGSVSGRVVCAGKPVEGASVSAVVGNNARAVVRTDSEGAFAFRFIPAGNYRLVASKDGYADARLWPVKVASKGSVSDLLLEMVVAGAVKGSVTDDVGRPVAHATVSICLLGPDDRSVRESFRTGSGEDGRFLKDALPPGRYRVIVSHGDHLGPQQEEIEVAPERTTEVNVLMKRACRIAGRVTDQEGEPVSGARIYVVAEGGATALYRFGATSDKNGAFVVRGLKPGSYGIRVDADGFVKKHVSGLEVRRGESVTDLHVELSEGLAVAGVVLDPDENPVAGVRVSVSPTAVPSGKQPDGYFYTNTDKDGRFRITGFTGAHPVIVSVSAADRGFLFFRLKDVKPPAEDLRLTLRRGLKVSGVVTATPPPQEFWILLFRSEPGGRWRLVAQRPFRRTDRFVVTGVEPGFYRLIGRARDYDDSDPYLLQLDRDTDNVVIHLERKR